MLDIRGAMKLIQKDRRAKSDLDRCSENLDDLLCRDRAHRLIAHGNISKLIEKTKERKTRIKQVLYFIEIEKQSSGLPDWIWDVNPKLLFTTYLKNEVLNEKTV
jgi:hypothetical protein